MKEKVLLAVLVIGYGISNAQILENKFNLSVGYKTGWFPGKPSVNNDNFISPSLFHNYYKVYGISIKGTGRTGSNSGIGACLDYTNASDWDARKYEDYLKSKIALYSFSPFIQIHNKFIEGGFANRVRTFINVGPLIGLANLSLVNSIFDIENENNDVADPLESSDLFFGFMGFVGLEVALNQVAGLNFETSFSHNWISSKLYSDSHFTNINVGLGLILNLRKEKHYNY